MSLQSGPSSLFSATPCHCAVSSSRSCPTTSRGAWSSWQSRWYHAEMLNKLINYWKWCALATRKLLIFVIFCPGFQPDAEDPLQGMQDFLDLENELVKSGASNTLLHEWCCRWLGGVLEMDSRWICRCLQVQLCPTAKEMVGPPHLRRFLLLAQGFLRFAGWAFQTLK